MICLIFTKKSLRIHLYRIKNTLLVTRAFKNVAAFVVTFYQGKNSSFSDIRV